MKTLSSLKARFVVSAGLLLAGAAAVYSAVAFNPAAQPYAYVPPLAISGFDLSKGDQKVFQTWFDPNVWRGDLVAYPVDATGHTDESNRLWYASERLALQDWNTDRRIITRNGAANVAFRWGELSAAQQASLGADPATAAKLLDFVRGDRSNEKELREEAGDGTVTILSGTAAGIFRARANVLGDIIHGKPIYVGAPPADYLFDGYPAFKSANSARAGMIYVGANDGMLHAFYADGDNRGSEAFAYIPGAVFPKLRALASQSYGHQFYVDGSPSMGDAFVAGQWRTVLVGGLNKGGQGVYAIDITDPGSVGTGDMMWEFTDADDPDLGFTYSQATIAKLREQHDVITAFNANDAELRSLIQDRDALIFRSEAEVRWLDAAEARIRHSTEATRGNAP